MVRQLETQLKTLQKRLRILDPLSTSSRQRKEVFDLVALVGDTIDDHHERFIRENVACTVRIMPSEQSHLEYELLKG